MALGKEGRERKEAKEEESLKEINRKYFVE
jgi:hypothetical protein